MLLFSGEVDNDMEFYLPNSTYIGGERHKLTLREIKKCLEVYPAFVELESVF